MKKSLKPPKSSGISPKFTISKRDCKINNMNNSLSNLVAKDWNNLPQLAKTSVKNASRPYYNVDIYKNILDFVAQVKTHYSHHINLVSFVTKLKDYLRLPEVKEDLMIQIDQSIENANNDYLTAIAEKSSRKTRATSKALEKAMASKAAAAELFEEFTLNRKKSTESLSTVSISSDGIELDREEEDDPIATRIKQEAVRLHRLYKSGETLDPLEVHRMACGLSSILNLTCTSQKQLFTDEEWNQLATRFTSIAIRYAPVDKKLMTNWALACVFSRSDGNAFRAMNHLALTRTANFGNTSLYQKLMIMENILLTVQNESFLLSTLNEGTLSQLKKISEEDIFFKLWSPIINGLINVNKRLRLKSGDTVNLVSTAAKKQLYSEAQQVIGFKIDIRIVYDFEDEEIDLCAGEISKGTLNNAKVWHDDSKLIREGKDILNQLYDLCGNRKNNELYSWSIQISGLQCVVSTQHLCSNGLYVSVPRFDFVFPKNLSSLDELDNMYKGLLTAIEDMERRSYLVENFLKQNQEQEQSNLTNVLGFNQFNDEDTSKVEEDVYSFKRPSWYTPPREERYKSVIPVHLFGRRRSATTISSISLSNPTTANNTVPDEYGFYEYDGKYKNIEFPDLIFDTHPHQHE